jgi:ketosteroid isomerase-like protein
MGIQMSSFPNYEGEIERGARLLPVQLNKLAAGSQDQTSAKPSMASAENLGRNASINDDIKNIIIKRFDAIKNRDEAAVRALIDERYNKFDDWPPFERQDRAKALENEFAAFKVMSNYTYELKDFEANVFGDAAVATFTIHYQGQIRDRPFDMNSRVTSVLKKTDSGWKIVHEHLSRFPEQNRQRQQYMSPRRMMQP